jgi:hypothetical protein
MLLMIPLMQSGVFPPPFSLGIGGFFIWVGEKRVDCIAHENMHDLAE